MIIKISVVISFFLCNLISATALAGAFQANGDGTVTDFATGLIWQQADDGTTKTHAVALSYCAALSLGGSNAWRLPEVKELSSLVDYNDSEVAINRQAFPTTVASVYWSASARTSSSSSAWYVFFNSGSVSSLDKTGSYYVRCVR